MTRDFWLTAGRDLLAVSPEGELQPTESFMRAYISRPEMQPVEESCAAEIALYEELLERPGIEVPEARIDAMEDPAKMVKTSQLHPVLLYAQEFAA